MYYYLGYGTSNCGNIKAFYMNSIVESSSYLFRKEDGVKDKIIEKVKNKYVEYNDNITNWDVSDVINTSIIEKLAKQIISYRD